VKKSAHKVEMPSEPDWLASISSGTVCTWFFILAIINTFFSIAGVAAGLYLISKGSRSPISFIVPFTIVAIGFINAWAMFVVCNRGINHEAFGSMPKPLIK
jgi:hypothetical protein